MILKIDRLSGMPEEILSRILSLMPTKFAVRTSTLSRKWRYTWTSVTNLVFDDIHPYHAFHCLSNLVDRVLELCKTPEINLFQIESIQMWDPKSPLSKWISEAVRLKVQKLVLRVHLLELPVCLFTCKTLVKLELVWGMNDWEFRGVWKVSSPVDLPCLKNLDLTVFCNPSENAIKLIHGCPVLETLSLEVRWRVDDEDFSFNIPTVKRFELKTPKCMSSVFNRIILNVPNLEHLIVGGTLSSLFVMEDFPSMVEVTSTFNYVNFNHLWVEFLKGVRGAKSLSWSSSNIKEPSNSLPPKFPNLKHSDLQDSFVAGWLLNPQLLETSSELESLSIRMPQEFNWIEPQSVPICILTKLRTMKILQSKGRKCDIKFIEYMLKNSEVLKTVTITCERLSPLEETWFCSQLLKLPRASRVCEVHFVGNGSHSASSQFY